MVDREVETEVVVDRVGETKVVSDEVDTGGKSSEVDTEGDEVTVEVGGEVDVTEGIRGMEVELPKQTWEAPWPTTITGVALPSPLASPRTITMLVPGGIDT